MNYSFEEDLQIISDHIKKRDIRCSHALILGGAGFLGSWMCDALVHNGSMVTCVDNFASGLPLTIRELKDDPLFQFIEHDVSIPFHPKGDFDLVIHMASRASPFEFAHHPVEILDANTRGVCNALTIARENNAKFLFTSTSEIYGDPLIVPTPETYRGNVSTTGPRGCYDEAKRCGEAYVAAFHRQYGLDTRIVRIFNTYGPRMRMDGIYGRVIPRFISQSLNNEPITIFGDGSQTRSFCYVTDEIRGLLTFATLEGLSGEVINIGNNSEITILELAKLIKQISGSSSQLKFEPLPEDDPLRRNPVITKAGNLLSWEPKVSLESGLKKMIEWVKGDPFIEK